MKIKINLTIALAILATLFISASCDKIPDFSYYSRVPQKVEFTKRVLPPYAKIGSVKPECLELIDLGLSVKWANINLGAETVDAVSPSLWGDKFAWAEIQTKSIYEWSTYEYNDVKKAQESGVWPEPLFITKYCFDHIGEYQDIEKGGVNLDLLDDAAYIYYGEGFRMPTRSECQELIDNCTWTCTEDKTNNVYVYTVTGKNGNSIKFMSPSGETVQFWSSTLSEIESTFSYYFRTPEVTNKNGKLEINETMKVYQDERKRGMLIRAVGI